METILPYRLSDPQLVEIDPHLSNHDYHSLPSLSSTGAKLVLEAPAKYAYSREQPKTSTASMQLGTAVHSAVLEDGEDMEVVEASSWRTAAAKEARADAEAAGKVALLPQEAATVNAIRDAVYAHPVAAELLSHKHGRVEESYLWTDQETGVDMRARPDLYVPGKAVVDLKTSGTAVDAHSFTNTIARFQYHLQAAWYLNAVYAAHRDPTEFVWIAVETTPPHLVATYSLDYASLIAGFELMDDALRAFQAASMFDSWVGYPPELETLTLPNWAL